MPNVARSMVVLAALLLAALAACGGDDAVDDPGDRTTTGPPTSAAPSTTGQDGGMNDPTTTTAPGGAPSGSQVERAVADLSGRLGLDEEAVTVVSQETVTWPDGSLGCPQPGVGYTQALVEGTRIILEAEGQTYSYHAAATGAPFYCDDPQPPAGES